MSFVLMGMQREAQRRLNLEGEYLIGKHSIEFMCVGIDEVSDLTKDAKSVVRKVKKIKAGDYVWLKLSGTVTAQQRILQWVIHPDLARCGAILTPMALQLPGDKSIERIRFGCTDELDMSKLDYLAKVLVYDQVVRT